MPENQTQRNIDRWKCPDCGIVYVDPVAPIAKCRCGSERIQLREWSHDPDDWNIPDWPADSEYSPDPHDIETDVRYENDEVGR